MNKKTRLTKIPWKLKKKGIDNKLDSKQVYKNYKMIIKNPFNQNNNKIKNINRSIKNSFCNSIRSSICDTKKSIKSSFAKNIKEIKEKNDNIKNNNDNNDSTNEKKSTGGIFFSLVKKDPEAKNILNRAKFIRE